MIFLLACNEMPEPSGSIDEDKPRVVVITDMTHDDDNSLIRLLHYSHMFDMEAIIVTPQLPDFEYDSDVPWEKTMEILEAYNEILPNLLRHHDGFPSYEDLLAVTKRGQGALPILWQTEDQQFDDWIGDGTTPDGVSKDSEGSDFLQEVFAADDDRPIFVQLWGGPIPFVQALVRYRENVSEVEFQELLDKLHVYSIHLQDMTIDYMIDLDLLREKECGGFNMGSAVSTFDGERVEPNWFVWDHGHFWAYISVITPEEVHGHSPLADLYDDGGEGDTPAFLYLISAMKGLNDPLQPTQGSWGNMFAPMSSPFPDGYYHTCLQPNDELMRWIDHAKNSFMARLQWGENDPEDVNHAPVTVLNGDKGHRPIYIEAAPGEQIELNASGSYDPNGGELSFNWFHYHQADSYGHQIELESPSQAMITFRVPDDIADSEIHLVVEVQDTGEPVLTSYRRVIIKEH